MKYLFANTVSVVLLLVLFANFVSAEEYLAQTPEDNSLSKNILFLGDSLTAGYGLDERYAYPNLIGEKLQKLQKNYRITNAGISGDTTSGGLRRLDWLLRQRVDILVLALGANDGLRGIPLGLTEENLAEIIKRTKKKFPNCEIIVAGMLVPPNMGEKYANEFRALFPRVAKRHKALLVPFLLEGVAAVPSLNLPDGIHPTAEGHKVIAENVWKALEKLIAKRTSQA